MNTKLYFKLNELNGDKLFSLALFFMYEAGGDGDCCVISPNWRELANEFEEWLTIENIVLLRHDYGNNVTFQEGEKCVIFQPTYCTEDEQFNYWLLIQLPSEEGYAYKYQLGSVNE